MVLTLAGRPAFELWSEVCVCFAQDLRKGEPVSPNVADDGVGECCTRFVADDGEAGDGLLGDGARLSLNGLRSGSRLRFPRREGIGGACEYSLPVKPREEGVPLMRFVYTEGCTEDILCFGVWTTSARVNPSTCLTIPLVMTGSTESSLEKLLEVLKESRTWRGGSWRRPSPRLRSIGTPSAARTFGDSGGISTWSLNVCNIDESESACKE